MSRNVRERVRPIECTGLFRLNWFHFGNSLTSPFSHGDRKRLGRELDGQSDAPAAQDERVKVMDGINPRVVLRNYIAQNAIEAAEDGDFSEVNTESL